MGLFLLQLGQGNIHKQGKKTWKTGRGWIFFQSKHGEIRHSTLGDSSYGNLLELNSRTVESLINFLGMYLWRYNFPRRASWFFFPHVEQVFKDEILGGCWKFQALLEGRSQGLVYLLQTKLLVPCLLPPRPSQLLS